MTIFGFVSIIPSITVEQTSFSLLLISRRSIYRNGRRYNTRGVDMFGHVANFVETEQIVLQNNGLISSFVQVPFSFSIKSLADPREHSSGVEPDPHTEILPIDPCFRSTPFLFVPSHRV